MTADNEVDRRWRVEKMEVLKKRSWIGSTEKAAFKETS